MVDRNLVGRCGLYCGSCTIYRAGKDSEQLRKIIAEREKCKPEGIRCEGCQTVLANGWDNVEWGRNCKIVKCQEAKGLKLCCECDDYPKCEKFHDIADSCLKHGERLMDNLEKIKNGKIDDWLMEEERKWTCPSCSMPRAMHLSECHWCKVMF